IGDANSKRPASLVEARLGRAVAEDAAAEVLVECDDRIASVSISLECGPVGYQHVHIAVVVVVEERGAVAVGFNDVVVGSLSAHIHESQTGLRSHVLETGEALEWSLRQGHRGADRHQEPGDMRTLLLWARSLTARFSTGMDNVRR